MFSPDHLPQNGGRGYRYLRTTDSESQGPGIYILTNIPRNFLSVLMLDNHWPYRNGINYNGVVNLEKPEKDDKAMGTLVTWSVKWPRDPGYRGAWLLGSEDNAEHGGLTAWGQPHPLPWITCSVLVTIIICWVREACSISLGNDRWEAWVQARKSNQSMWIQKFLCDSIWMSRVA